MCYGTPGRAGPTSISSAATGPTGSARWNWAEGKLRIGQDFLHPEGTRTRLAHDSTHGPGESFHDQAYNVAEDGTWEERRSYDWKLTQAAD